MNSEQVFLSELTLLGTFLRTCNKNEQNPQTAKIPKHFHEYFANNVSNNLNNRISPCMTYSVYTEYQNNENGEYTHLLGEAVNSLANNNNPEYKKIIIPASNFIKFTTPPGKLPDVVINAWQYLWSLSSEQLGGKRTYQADFEVYDHRSLDPSCAIVDIYIGIH